MAGQVVGYGRVSSTGQSLELQVQRLTGHGCEKIFTEKLSGKRGCHRPELARTLEYVREGDVMVVTKLDRLARSVADLASIGQSLEAKGVDLVVLDQAIDTTTPSGRLLFHVLGAIGEFERDLIADRTSEGRAAAMARGVRFGRPPAADDLSDNQLAALVAEFDRSDTSKQELAAKYNMSRATLYRVVAKARGTQDEN